MRKSGYPILIFLVAVFAWIMAGETARAEEKQPVLTGGDESSGYKYLIPGVGSFDTNCKLGDSNSFVYVSPGEGLAITKVRKDGSAYNGDDGIYFEDGVYEVYIGNGIDEAVFSFTVREESDSIMMSLSSNSAEVNIVREPDMQLLGGDGYFRYVLNDGEWIEANVPQGAYTRGNVQLSSSSGLTSISGFRNGEFITSEDNCYKQEGSYIITFWELEPVQGDKEVYRVDFCFDIIREPTMNLSMVTAPMGMKIAYAKKDGDAYPTEDTGRLFAKADGDYEILFTGINDASLIYSMSFTRDTVPPALKFKPEFVKGEVLDEPLYYSGGEDIAELRILRDGVEVTAVEGVIRVNGKYALDVADRAGNSRRYEFIIKNGIPLPVGRMVIIPVILIIAGGIILVHARKNMRVL